LFTCSQKLPTFSSEFLLYIVNSIPLTVAVPSITEDSVSERVNYILTGKDLPEIESIDSRLFVLSSPVAYSLVYGSFDGKATKRAKVQTYVLLLSLRNSSI